MTSTKGHALDVGAPIAGTRYRVVRSLGAGGMGVVYQVVKPPNIQGVLKLMSSELTRHEEHRLRFFDEVRILAQLDHPNIVKVFDYDALPDGTPFYVMELLSGRTVRDVITTLGRVPPRVAYEITRQLLEALQAAHTHDVPVIHRDIKPENIFLHTPRHGEPVVKLIDFGVSAVADRKHDGTFVGTWSYAAPEQIRGATPTPATDLYAAGLVLFEMLAGSGPFDHHVDWVKISKAQLEEIPPPVSTFAPWVPTSIVALIQSALAKDPAARPPNAYAFAERLFELEWASDGKNPHDFTAEGPSPSARVRAAPANPAPRVAGPDGATVNGPLSRVLSTIGAARPSSKKMAAASPASDRLGDIPLIGVPPEHLRAGPTWQGVGGRDHTSPDADALLAGLGVPARKPPSKRERESDPEVGMVARDAQVGVELEARSPHGGNVVRSPAREPAATVDEVATPGARDTFSSQQSEPRGTLPQSRRSFYAAATLMTIGMVTALLVFVRGTDANHRPPSVAPPTGETPASPPALSHGTSTPTPPTGTSTPTPPTGTSTPTPPTGTSAPTPPTGTSASPPAGADAPATPTPAVAEASAATTAGTKPIVKTRPTKSSSGPSIPSPSPPPSIARPTTSPPPTPSTTTTSADSELIRNL